MADPSKNKRPRILIVDDQDDDIALLKRKLARSYEIEVARDAGIALRKIAEREPDLALLDLKLPDMDGADLLMRIKELSPLTAVVVMAAYGSEEVARKVMRLGVSDYVIKAIDFKRIAPIVRSVLDRRRLAVEKWKLEKELRGERDYLQTIVDCSADAIVTIDPAGSITFFSPGAEELFRVKKAQVIGESLARYLLRGEEELKWILSGVRTEGRIRNKGVDFQFGEGQRFITFLSSSVLKDEDGTLKGILLVIKDVTRNIKLEREIFESKTALESVFDSIVDPLAVISPDLFILRANRASARLGNLDVKRTIGKRCHLILAGSEKECEVCPVSETFRTRAPSSAEMRSAELGEIFIVNSYPIFDYHGELTGVIEHRMVITGQKRLEEERRRLEMELMERHKLSSIGMLVQGVAHNLNTPLGVILGRSELLQAEIDEVLGEKIPRLLDEAGGEGARDAADSTKAIRGSADACLAVILKQVDKMSRIIGNMMQKSRQEQDSERKRISLNQVLQEELTFLDADMTFKHEIEKQVHLDPEIPYIEGIYSDFSQSFTNIIRNAIDAMYHSDLKILTVTTRHDDRFIYVSFHDTGEGIEEGHIPKLFDPFFTTKEFASKDGGPTGVGLGLHSCYQLLNPYGVVFEVESGPGNTTFTVKIPIQPAAPEGE